MDTIITENSIPKTPNPDMTTPTGTTPTMSYVPAFGGIGLGGILFILFLVLKLAQVKPFKSWSWLRVTAPLWLPVAAVAFFAMILFFMGRITTND